MNYDALYLFPWGDKLICKNLPEAMNYLRWSSCLKKVAENILDVTLLNPTFFSCWKEQVKQLRDFSLVSWLVFSLKLRSMLLIWSLKEAIQKTHGISREPADEKGLPPTILMLEKLLSHHHPLQLLLLNRKRPSHSCLCTFVTTLLQHCLGWKFKWKYSIRKIMCLK